MAACMINHMSLILYALYVHIYRLNLKYAHIFPDYNSNVVYNKTKPYHIMGRTYRRNPRIDACIIFDVLMHSFVPISAFNFLLLFLCSCCYKYYKLGKVRVLCYVYNACTRLTGNNLSVIVLLVGYLPGIGLTWKG